MNFAFAHFYPENGCEYTSIFRVYTYTYTYVHVRIHTIKFVFYYISYVKFLRTVIDRKENQIDLKNQKPWLLDAR